MLIAVVIELERSLHKSLQISFLLVKVPASRKNDMLQCFIVSKYKDGRPTTEAEVTGLLIAALFAAVVDEQKQQMQKHGTKVDHDVLSEMDNLYRCIKEAPRLHPPLIMLLRSSNTDFSVKTRDGKEYDIPKGHIVATSPAFANRLPYIFKDPDTHDPDRFRVGREEDKVAGVGFWQKSHIGCV
ncbi:Sterol 14-demethylase [Hibiscus syriacus]|uniref:Sterol 14-demethylase n=1 Tax=Hibiscus syriacus TaxID=106335 RepID=A0A6A2YCJ1_HIBSY|nr:Sterol 14-demethylase [Hibiscus syriacus]